MDDWLTLGTYGKIKVKGRSQKSNEDSGFSNQDSVTRIQVKNSNPKGTTTTN